MPCAAQGMVVSICDAVDKKITWRLTLHSNEAEGVMTDRKADTILRDAQCSVAAVWMPCALQKLRNALVT